MPIYLQPYRMPHFCGFQTQSLHVRNEADSLLFFPVDNRLAKPEWRRDVEAS